jgi:nicotinamidase-related amidase
MNIDSYFLEKENTVLILMDIQSKLISLMIEKEKLLLEIKKIVQIANIFNLPIIVTEHYPRLLGTTIEEIRRELLKEVIIKKSSFNCCESEEFNNHLNSLERRKLILVGVETHICILQTALTLIKRGYIVHIPIEATSSRTIYNKETGLNMMRDAGVIITSVETIIFQLLKKVEAKEFKEIMKIVK